MNVCTRIAPSPTGVPHVGTAYIALFNYCLARKHGGKFLLRLEDTDQSRSHSHYAYQIMDILKWLGLDWDGGFKDNTTSVDDLSAYTQSTRSTIYQQYAQQLLEAGKAFYCFASVAELDKMRSEQIARGETPRYDGRGLELSKTDIQKRLNKKEPHVIRLHVPASGDCVFEDQLRGKITVPWQQIDMQILIKADGLPTYHLANVVDDNLSGISHVLRGEEWINSTPKHILLYQALGWQTPVWCHLPLLRNPDGTKLSKRRNPVSVLHYRNAGYLPEALCNYLGRMGWSMPNDAERFSVTEMIDSFDLNRISLGAPIFDIEKLNWLNGEWIRTLDHNALADRIIEWLPKRDFLLDLMPATQKRIEKLSDLIPLCSFLLADKLDISKKDFESLDLTIDTQRELLQCTLWHLNTVHTEWQAPKLFESIKALAQALEIPLKQFMAPLFLAITGSLQSISVNDAMVLLGADKSARRIEYALTLLTPLSKKELKALEKHYRTIAIKA